MKQRLTREEFLEYIFSENYEALQGDKLRLVRIRIPGSEVSLAHLIGVSDSEVYKNLGLIQERALDYCSLHPGKVR